jgi:hypothetical protein
VFCNFLSAYFQGSEFRGLKYQQTAVTRCRTHCRFVAAVS